MEECLTCSRHSWKVSGGRIAGNASCGAYAPQNSLGHDVSCQRGDQAKGRGTGLLARRLGEDGVAIAWRVGWDDGACKAVVGHACDLRRLRLGQPCIGCNHSERGVFTLTGWSYRVCTEQAARIGQARTIKGSDTRNNFARGRVDNVADRVHDHQCGHNKSVC